VTRDLPPGTRLAAAPIIHGGSAQLSLRLPGPRLLTIQYGRAGFDGCGPLHPRAVTVAGAPAVLEVDTAGGRPYTTLVWPARPASPHGRYGLSGHFSAARLLALAASMAPARATALHAGSPGNC
jgi:hypothetical protein